MAFLPVAHVGEDMHGFARQPNAAAAGNENQTLAVPEPRGVQLRIGPAPAAIDLSVVQAFIRHSYPSAEPA